MCASVCVIICFALRVGMVEAIDISKRNNVDVNVCVCMYVCMHVCMFVSPCPIKVECICGLLQPFFFLKEEKREQSVVMNFPLQTDLQYVVCFHPMSDFNSFFFKMVHEEEELHGVL